MKISFHHEIKPDDKITSDQIIDLILKNRKIKDIDEFLNPSSPLKINLADFGPPAGGKQQITKTIKLLEKIKKENGMIVVYTDYDADGITGGAILWETLYLLDFKVMPYVPHRKNEGYGFSKIGIDNVKKKYNPSLIISVDHGITAKEKVIYAKKLGIPIIITDHHLKPDKLPIDAEAIFHIPELSGSGVSYFFSKMIFEHFKVRHPKGVHSDTLRVVFNNFQTDYLVLASIGTVADMVPLIGPSRSIVKYGLEAFQHIKRVGLKHILKEAGIEGKKISPYEIGFIIAPRINAVGRLEHAIDALRLLCTKDEKKAEALANHVGERNRERQDMVKKAVEEALLRIKASEGKLKKLPKLIILTSDRWHEGIIGLIASKITEKFYRPTIVMTKTDLPAGRQVSFYKGSARSIASFHITNFLRDLKKYLIDVGGHKGAAGFTIEEKNITIFSPAAIKMVNKLIKNKDLERKIEADLKIPLSKATLRVAKELEKLAPFGIGNPSPIFYSQGELIDAKLFGKNSDYLKIFLKNENSFPLELISFNSADQFTKLSRGKMIDVVFNLEVNRWGGEEKVRGKIIYYSLIE